MSPVRKGVLDDTHDSNDPYTTLTTSPRQRQQQQQQQPALQSPFLSSPPQSPLFNHPSPTLRSASATTEHRSLRRVSPIGGGNQPLSSSLQRRVASADANPRLRTQLDDQRQTQHSGNPAIGRRAATSGVTSANIAPALSEAETEAGASIAGDSVTQLDDSYWPSRSTRVSPRTASAIRWVLEEAIRKPFPFTPVLEELNAPMSEFTGPSGPAGATAVPQPRPQNGGSRPVQGGSRPPVHTQVPAGMRTPRDIMRDRIKRDAEKKEANDREREKEQEQARQYAVGAAAGEAQGPRGQPVGRQPTVEDPAAYSEQPVSYQQPQATSAGTRRKEPDRPIPTDVPRTTQRTPQSRPVTTTAQKPAPTKTAPNTFQQPQPQPQMQTQSSQPPPRQPLPSQGISQPAPAAAQPAQTTAQDQLKRTTFPHAFERWETLSSHWEGLTGYWIRKLEQNNNELSQDPLSQQMARQINDLSAAGANLFHAVVELQRLRASSERRFQRWFFDTRAEQEKAREVQADLERQVSTLQLERDDALELRQKADADRKRAEDLVKEMRRELQISKEEARRAWEELGRREQEERDRTASLRNGEPTVVGGVQVLPMIAGMPSRQSSSANRAPVQQDIIPYPSGHAATGGRGQHELTEQEAYHEEPSLTETDPFVETAPRTGQGYHQSSAAARPPTSSSATIVGGITSASQPPPISTSAHVDPTAGFYQHGRSAIHNEAEPDTVSYVASTEGSEIEGEYGMDQPEYHRRNPHEYAGSEGYDDQEEDDEGEPYDSTPYPPGTSAASVHGYGQGNVDYSGSGWGGWDSITPRHRHPTRLSDVLEEEDERSRTSPSRASQASRGLH